MCHLTVKLVTEKSGIKGAAHVTSLSCLLSLEKSNNATRQRYQTTLAKGLESYTMNLTLFLKPAAYPVADVVLSVSRDCCVVLGSLLISIRQCGFACKEASTLSTAECSFLSSCEIM